MRQLHWSGWSCIGVIVGIRAVAPDEAAANSNARAESGALVRAKVLVNDTGSATLWINRRVAFDEPLALRLPSRRIWLECLHSPMPIELRSPASETQPFDGTSGVGVACLDIAAGRYRILPHDEHTHGPSRTPDHGVELRVTG